MASLTFKDVGQGDSILLEWSDGASDKIGIIDCSKKSGKDTNTNPVLDYLILKNCRSIEFIILSHPHFDHYSGLLELLEYCSNQKIPIGWFGHTALDLGEEYWKLFEPYHAPLQELEKIFTLLIDLEDRKLLGYFQFLTENVRLNIGPKILLETLSPSPKESRRYQAKVKRAPGINRDKASQAANLLATIMLITINDTKILVTSDAVISAFKRLRKTTHFSDIDISSIQVPHHGSKKNYHNPFWKGLSIIGKKTAVVSSGLNKKYKHPNLEVLLKLDSIGFDIHATNIVYGMKEYLNYKQIKNSTTVLDIISETIDESGKDQVYHF